MKNFIKRITDRIHRKPLLVKPVVSHMLLLDKINSMRTTQKQKDERDKVGLYEVAGWEHCLNMLENWVKDGCNCG